MNYKCFKDIIGKKTFMLQMISTKTQLIFFIAIAFNALTQQEENNFNN